MTYSYTLVLPNDVTVTYWRITAFSVSLLSGEVHVTLSAYTNEAAWLAAKTPAFHQELSFTYPGTPPYEIPEPVLTNFLSAMALLSKQKAGHV